MDTSDLPARGDAPRNDHGAPRAGAPSVEAAAGAWPVGWVLASAVAIVASALWQQAPGWIALAVSAAATIVAAALLPSLRRPLTLPLATVMLLAVTVTLATSQTITLTAVERDWTSWSAREREARADQVGRSLEDVAGVLTVAAQRVATDSALLALARADAPRTQALIKPPLPSGVESAVLVFDDGRLIARTGQAHTPVFPGGPEGVHLLEGPFHTSLVSRVRLPDGDVEVVAMALISSAPPANRFARSLLQTLPGRVDVAHTVVESADSAGVAPRSSVRLVLAGDRPVARVRALEFMEGETRLQLLQRARAQTNLSVLLALTLLLISAWRRPARTAQRMTAAAVAVVALAVTPLSALSNVSPLFDPASFFAPMGGPFTANVAALLMTAVIALAVLFLVLRDPWHRASRAMAIVVVLMVAVGGPFLLRDLSRGISLPVAGAGTALWMAWQLALALVGVSLLVAVATAGRAALGQTRGLSAAIAPAIAVCSAVLAPALWDAPGAWPAWYPALWIAAIGAVALTRRGLSQVLAAAIVAGCGATTLTWGETVRARMALAQVDLERLSAVDENAYQLLERLAVSIREDSTRAGALRTTEALLRRYAASELALAGYPASLARWSPDRPGEPVAKLSLALVTDTVGAQALMASMARDSRIIEIRAVDDGPTTILIAAVPSDEGTVTTIAVPPRTRLLPLDPFAAFTGVTGARGAEPPYRLSLTAPLRADTVPQPLTWRRRSDAMHGDGVAGNTADMRRVHVEVALRGTDELIPRGALLVFLDVLVVLLIWGVTAFADGVLGRLLRVRRIRWSRSYRVRLSGAMLMFFIAPAGIFAVWAWLRLQDDDRSARALLVRETLRVAAAETERQAFGTARSSTGAPLFLYRDGLLVSASDSLIDALAPLGRLLPMALTFEGEGTDDVFETRRVNVGTFQALVGFRTLSSLPAALDLAGAGAVLATPARGGEFALDARREDLGILVFFATLMGALAAVWSSGLAARALARPVGALREAALAIAAGKRPPSLGTAPATEFAPVYRAFERMAADLVTSRTALEAAQRRTEAVLQNVASGVVALRADGAVIIANPRAESMLGVALRNSEGALALVPPPVAPLVARVTAFLNSTEPDAEFDLTVQQRTLRARLTRLAGGGVLTLDDVTDLASAQRVLAWGEMARQVAHEIKNPLTPIRLGVQHLRRAYRDGRGDFATILDTNVTRVLAEIDHLDQIARAFSRYGTAPEDRPPAVRVDVADVVADVVSLERLGDAEEREHQVRWLVETPAVGDESIAAVAQRDELKEVLLNLLENARLADARQVSVRVNREDDRVVLEVSDNGSGIAPDVLPHVFEPHFSTRTSGSGLGLAISRRLIEGWGGTIGVTNRESGGTTVRITLPRWRSA